MDLPKTLVSTLLDLDSLILLFDDGEVIKFEAEVDSDFNEPI